jgi:hypothetical protein
MGKLAMTALSFQRAFRCTRWIIRRRFASASVEGFNGLISSAATAARSDQGLPAQAQAAQPGPILLRDGLYRQQTWHNRMAPHRRDRELVHEVARPRARQDQAL